MYRANTGTGDHPMRAILFAAGVCLWLVSWPGAAAFGCHSTTGEAVDWWVALKLPNGVQYVYKDSLQAPTDSPSLGPALEWQFSSQSLAATAGNPLAMTLSPLYGNITTTTGYVLYNDAPPDEPVSTKKAHAKGVLAFTSANQGFWLVHSVPKFPSQPDFGPYNGILEPEQLYAQSFLCMSLNSSQLERAATLMQTSDVNIYASNMPHDQPDLYPAVASLLLGNSSAPLKAAEAFQTFGGMSMKAFAKTPSKTRLYLYEEIVEPALQTGLAVETWLNGGGAMASDCGPFSRYSSLNVQNVYVDVASAGWSVHSDHSKWAVSIEGDTCKVDAARDAKAICIGDINREESQSYRGGGTVCFLDNPALWAAFRGIIASCEPCANGASRALLWNAAAPGPSFGAFGV